MKLVDSVSRWDRKVTIEMTLKELMHITAAVGNSSIAEIEEECQHYNKCPKFNCCDDTQLWTQLKDVILATDNIHRTA